MACDTVRRTLLKHARGVGGFGIVGLADADVTRDASQLSGEVLPLPDAEVVQELLATHPSEGIAR